MENVLTNFFERPKYVISLMKEKNMERQTYMSTLIPNSVDTFLTYHFLKYKQC